MSSSGNTKRERDIGRKYETGSVKRQKKKAKEEFGLKISGSLDKYVVSSTASTCNIESMQVEKNELSCTKENTLLPNTVNGHIPSKYDDADNPENCSPIISNIESLQAETNEPSCSQESTNNTNSFVPDTIIYDPSAWSLPLNDKDRLILVRKGPIRENIVRYPIDCHSRHFSTSHYTRILNNDEKQDRRWLVYAKNADKVFCFPCRLFSSSNTAFSYSGCNDWKNISTRIKSHEGNPEHLENVLKWLELEKKLKTNQTVDSELQSQLQAERQRWKDILERILAIIEYLATHNLPFRAHREDLFSENSGNFLGLVKFTAMFDPIMRSHLERIADKSLHNHYLGKNIQNALIDLMARQVKQEIIKRVQQAKYYSIILDCTRDVSRVEQMSLVLRYVDVNSGDIKEHFIGFIPVEKTTGADLADYVLSELKSLGLKLEDCRGQGYDNGANMKGHKSGVQARILDMNPLAFFTPCEKGHNWNLLLGDAAASCTSAKLFFGILQRLYTLFSASPVRWAALKEKVNLTLKPLSETRWECRIESVKAVRYQLEDVADCLEALSDIGDPALYSECRSLRREILSYEFIISLIVWYDILFKINIISKLWQKVNMDLSTAMKHFEGFLTWISEYRKSGWVSVLVDANSLAEEIGVNKEFKQTRIRKKKCLFDYEGQDEIASFPEDLMRTQYFYVVIDCIQTSLSSRFMELQRYQFNFGFLCNIAVLRNKPDQEILDSCRRLETALTIKRGNGKESEELYSDINCEELYQELKMFSRTMPEEGGGVAKALKDMVSKELSDVYPNLFVAIRVLLTIPVAVASAERSFSKLKLIKTYLRSTMSQERLSALAILSIERELSTKLNYSSIINDFSEAKSRKIPF